MTGFFGVAMPLLCLVFLFAQVGSPKLERKLINALDEGQTKDVKNLLFQGADPNRRVEGDTLLVHAVRAGDPEMVSALLKAGALKLPVPGNRALIAALEHDRFGIAQLLLQSGFSAYEKDDQNWTPLALAIDRKAHVLYRSLIKRGKPIDEILVEGNTALHFAVMHDDVWAAALLVKAGANPHRPNENGMTAAEIVMERKYDEMVALFESGILRRTDNLVEAAYLGDLARVVDLLQKGANINGAMANGMTPLMAAAAAGDVQALSFLIAKGADLNAQDINGLTPLVYAIQKERVAAATVLLDAGADREIEDFHRIRPLGHALATWDNSLIRLLGDRGSRVFYTGKKEISGAPREMSDSRMIHIRHSFKEPFISDPWTVPAKAEKKVEPTYPKRSYDIEGTVVLSVFVSLKGYVISSETMAVTGNVPRAFGRAARKAVNQWTFKPSTNRGEPKSYMATVVLDVKEKAR